MVLPTKELLSPNNGNRPGLRLLWRLTTTTVKISRNSPLTRILFYRHRDFYMGHVPPTYSPCYNDVVRVYGLSDPSNPTFLQPSTVAARAAKSMGPWDKVIQSLYLLPSADFRFNSTSSLERGGVTDTYDSGTLSSPVSLTLVDRPNSNIRL